MPLLARGLSWLVGSNLIAPLSLLAALTFAHQAWMARDQRLVDQGVTQCEGEQALAVMRAQRDQARHAVEAAVKAIEQEKQLTETMRHDHQTIAKEFASYKDRASADPRCLSDGVLDLLRGNVPVGQR